MHNRRIRLFGPEGAVRLRRQWVGETPLRSVRQVSIMLLSLLAWCGTAEAGAVVFADDFESGAPLPEKWYVAPSGAGRIGVGPCPCGSRAVHLTTRSGNCEIRMVGRVYNEPFTLAFRFFQPASENHGYAGVVRFSSVRHFWWIEWMPPRLNVWTTAAGKWAVRWSIASLACDTAYTVVVRNRPDAVRIELRNAGKQIMARSIWLSHDDGPPGSICFGAHSGKGLRGVWFDDIRLTAAARKRSQTLGAEYKRQALPGVMVQRGSLAAAVSRDKGLLLGLRCGGRDLLGARPAAVSLYDFTAHRSCPETTMVCRALDEGEGRVSAALESPGAPGIRIQSGWRMTGDALYWDCRVGAEFAAAHETAIEFRVPIPAWADRFFAPSRGAPFTRRTVRSGFRYRDASNGVEIPLITLYSAGGENGFSLFADPAVPIPALSFELDPANREPNIYVSFRALRLSNKVPAHVRLILIPHASGWRPGLGWVLAHYPKIFMPDTAVSEGHQVIAGRLPAARIRELRRLGFRWQEMHLVRCPFYGEYLTKETPQSDIDAGRQYLDQVHREHFHYFCYWSFNETRPDFARRFADGISRGRDGKPQRFGWHHFTWMVPLPGASWHEHVLEQLRRIADTFPGLDGVFCDNTIESNFTFGQDDGVSMRNGRACCQYAFAQHATLAAAKTLLRARGMGLWANGACDMNTARWLDGILVENDPTFLESQQFLGLTKPLVFITYYKQENPRRRERLVRMLGTALRCGVLLGFNEWELKPKGPVDLDILQRWLPMFEVLRRRRWVLEPRAVEAPEGILANIFRSPAGYAVPLVRSRAAPAGMKKAAVRIRVPDAGRIRNAAIYAPNAPTPGWRSIEFRRIGHGTLACSPPWPAPAVMLLFRTAAGQPAPRFG